ncbi:MAG: GNAT family N-acetyltransferase [Candidatus Heimdallarchaeota archaeon]|nr:MAG: GNAT family N-acetyltransferase [Candidatus Heimdallarchaeota archaeon]
MIQQIPQNQLMNFWHYFKNHKMKNPLAQNLAWSKVKGFSDNLDNPDIVMFLFNHWACYLAGNNESEKLKEFLAKIPEKAIIYVPSLEWEPRLKPYWTYFGYLSRTELSAQNLSLEKIRRLSTALPEGFQIKRVDLEVAKRILSQNLADHWVNVINYLGGPEKFIEEGVGFCIQEGEKVVSIVMGYKASMPITQSIELDIVTHPDYRGRGFATLVSAKLIEYLLKEGIEPHWDAANPLSSKLATKLGFTDPEPYKCYYWRNKPWTISELKEAYDSQFKKGLENFELLKSEMGSFSAKGQENVVKYSLLSRLNKIYESINGILLNINRFLESRIVADSDIPQFKEYAKKINLQLNTIDKLKHEILSLD